MPIHYHVVNWILNVFEKKQYESNQRGPQSDFFAGKVNYRQGTTKIKAGTTSKKDKRQKQKGAQCAPGISCLDTTLLRTRPFLSQPPNPHSQT